VLVREGQGAAVPVGGGRSFSASFVELGSAVEAVDVLREALAKLPARSFGLLEAAGTDEVIGGVGEFVDLLGDTKS